MDFLISGTHISPAYLVVVGFVIGILGRFFGVGGSFLAGPALFTVGMPMNFVIGTDLAHIVGKSIVAAMKHRALGNAEAIVDMDVYAAEILEELHESLKKQGIVLGISAAKGHFLEVLRNTSFTKQATLNIYPSVAAAIKELSRKDPDNT